MNRILYIHDGMYPVVETYFGEGEKLVSRDIVVGLYLYLTTF